MDKESADELMGRQRHDLASGIVLVVPPLEADHAIGNAEYAVIGDSNTVRIAAKVLDNATSVFERRFAIDDPLLGIQSRKELVPCR